MYEYFAGIAITVAILAIEHGVTWNMRLHRVIRYILGVTALLVGQSLALYLRGEWMEIVGIWAVAGAGGMIVGGLHIWRQQIGQEPGEIESAFLAGQIKTEARSRHGEIRE